MEIKTRIALTDEDLKVLGLENVENKEVKNKVREILKLPILAKNTNKAQALNKLGLSNTSSHKELWAKIKELKI